MRRVTISAALLFLTLYPAGVRARNESVSAVPAATLRAQLEQLKLEAIAAPDPDERGRYVAALYIPGIQLLVVSAPYAVGATMDKKIAAGQYMDVYVEIQGVNGHKGHFFVEDVLADGLSLASDANLASDTTTLNGARPVVFNGTWGAQQLTEEEYAARFKQDDERYARMLKVLSTSLARKITVP